MRQSQQSFVRKGRSYERNPKWQAVRTEAGGSDDGEVQQVYKICVVAEIRVQLHRIRGYLVVSINGSGGGQDEQVHGGPMFGGRPAQIHEAIFSLVHIQGGVALSARNNAAHHRVHFIRMPANERLNGSQALRYPGTFVEQVGGGAED